MGKNIKNKQTEKESSDHNALYQDIVVSTNTLIWRTNAEGKFTFLNPAWENNYGYKVKEMLGKPFSDFQVPEAAEHYINAFRNCLIGESIIGHETTYFSKSGDEINLAINMIPLYDSAGVIVGTQGTAFDITERKRADELLQYISAKDELTGLYNLHTFLSMTEQQIKTANREKKEMLIIYTGVDGMQAINDDHGRETGDKVLIDTANILRKTFREADILARTGGDEFVISTLVASEDHKNLIMARLKENIKTYNAAKNGSLKLSLSLGTSFYNPEEPVSIEEVLSRADEKMHVDKKCKKM
ncbi:MAG: sensor domain-containing diguanylate cyclase [Nitrospirae bacterium]|nr:sensor domain-containing diguanylate cyclase [Nitrospirota bacterium]